MIFFRFKVLLVKELFCANSNKVEANLSAAAAPTDVSATVEATELSPADLAAGDCAKELSLFKTKVSKLTMMTNQPQRMSLYPNSIKLN